MPSARWYQVQGSHVPGTGYLVLGNMYQLPGTFQAGGLVKKQVLGVPGPWHKVPETSGTSCTIYQFRDASQVSVGWCQVLRTSARYQVLGTGTWGQLLGTC